ncbi:MAG TPA: hypothetical protein VM737_03665 [Gemmatimonadota bacterium]|nr:hypothetical protein [Gemmatimonadota bacterium]
MSLGRSGGRNWLAAGFTIAALAGWGPTPARPLAAQPYPGAKPLTADAGLQELMTRGMASFMKVTVQSFTTPASIAEVKAHLDPTLEGQIGIQETTLPDKDMRDMLDRAADDPFVAEIASAAGTDLSPAEYHAGFTAGFRDNRPERGQQGIGVRDEGGGTMTRVEVQRPYFDAGSLAWVDATRIRFVRMEPVQTTP